ncbi:hypothetical protein AVEN_29412-1 [Araneus ventricosus]|uniref:Uncharacterized protein n=1 Tax=Araneus ventricosus TaxID=182803 RepID=A0A4Y2D1X6_ARAVE|nr:hypothetical protein AVEN_29412-1 [Araneus ventricosus]
MEKETYNLMFGVRVQDEYKTNESTFHVINKVNKRNCRIWGLENPDAAQEVERYSPKINVWRTLSHDTVIAPFFFAETSVTANIYLDKLQIYAIPQMQHLQLTVILQQDGASLHWCTDVRAFLDTTFPNRWIRRGGPIALPSISPDVTLLNFFFWGYVKVYSRQIRDVEDLRASITAAIATVSKEMLQRPWLELAYRLDILRPRGSALIF